MTFNNYATRYRPGLDLVLNDVSIDISAGEKVAVFLLCSILRFSLLSFCPPARRLICTRMYSIDYFRV